MAGKDKSKDDKSKDKDDKSEDKDKKSKDKDEKSKDKDGKSKEKDKKSKDKDEGSDVADDDAGDDGKKKKKDEKKGPPDEPPSARAGYIGIGLVGSLFVGFDPLRDAFLGNGSFEGAVVRYLACVAVCVVGAGTIGRLIDASAPDPSEGDGDEVELDENGQPIVADGEASADLVASTGTEGDTPTLDTGGNTDPDVATGDSVASEPTSPNGSNPAETESIPSEPATTDGVDR